MWTKLSLLLFGITLALYWPTRYFNIVYYDDPLFVTDNPEVAGGLNWQGFKWAMTSITTANWQPVTNLSFVLTHQFFGTDPGAEHLVNVFIHAANAVLLFLALAQLIRLRPDSSTSPANMRCAVVAAIFALHPLRVESVCWITERKDVLFAFFFFIAVLAYAKFVEWQNERLPHVWIWHVTALIAFGLGFMSKAMIVTLPFVLLLLDFWPLQRFTIFDFRFKIFRLIREKFLFFATAFLFSLLTFWIQQTHAAVVPLEKLGAFERIENAVISYVGYLGKFFWPPNLAILYPYPRGFDFTTFAVSALLLLTVSTLCLLKLRQKPFLAVGWFWFLGTFVPVIGLVQIGETAMADRYTYLPLIGIIISLVWLVADWADYSLLRKFFLTLATIFILTILTILTSQQIQFWRNTVSLFEHTIDVTGENPSAQVGLAIGLEHENKLREAVLHYRIATAIAPGNEQARYNLAVCLDKTGYYVEALTEFESLLLAGYRRDDYSAQLNFADVFSHLGHYNDAVYHFERALQLKPDSIEVLNNFAWLLATCPDKQVRDGNRAIGCAKRACELSEYKKTVCIGTLAAAYAEAGQFDDAITTVNKAITNARQDGERELEVKNSQLLKIFQEHKPYHETISASNPTQEY